MWEYLVIEEPNPAALQGRLADAGRDRWEALGLASAGEARLVVVLKRQSAQAPANGSDRPGEMPGHEGVRTGKMP